MIPARKDHLLYGSVPDGLQFDARLLVRGRTIYLAPVTSDWLVAFPQPAA